MAHLLPKRFYCTAVLGLFLIAVSLLLPAAPAHAQMAVVGNWEIFDTNNPGGGGNFNSDGWIDWATDPSFNGFHGHPITESQFTTANPPKYSASTTTGVTLGSQSVEVQAAGYNQTLALKNEFVTGNSAAFFGNKAFAIDITYPAYTATQNASGGYQQIYQFFLNAGNGYGFNNLTANPVPGTGVGFAAGQASNPIASTMRVFYGNQLAAIGDTSTYNEIIFATNSDANHGTFFFDNARYYTPGDMNNDGHVDARDIPAMELALANPVAYKNTYWAGNTNYVDGDRILIGDMQGADTNLGVGPNGINTVGDGVFNGADLQYLLAYLKDGAGSTSSVPEPASIVLLALAIPVAYAARKRLRQV